MSLSGSAIASRSLIVPLSSYDVQSLKSTILLAVRSTDVLSVCRFRYNTATADVRIVRTSLECFLDDVSARSTLATRSNGRKELPSSFISKRSSRTSIIIQNTFRHCKLNIIDSTASSQHKERNEQNTRHHGPYEAHHIISGHRPSSH